MTSKGIRSALRCAVRTMSSRSGRPFSITAARKRRFIRFLRAAFPSMRGVAIPSFPLPGRAASRQYSAETRFPFRKTSSNRALEGPLLMRQPGAASKPPPSNHVTAIGRLHANAKAVRRLLVPVVGLIGSFHAWSKIAVEWMSEYTSVPTRASRPTTSAPPSGFMSAPFDPNVLALALGTPL